MHLRCSATRSSAGRDKDRVPDASRGSAGALSEWVAGIVSIPVSFCHWREALAVADAALRHRPLAIPARDGCCLSSLFGFGGMAARPRLVD